MQQFAAELDVDRSTLFRWVGNRDQLIVAILISLAKVVLKEAVARARGAGGVKLARVAGAYAQKIIDATYYRAFMQREPERSLRLITTKASPLQQHIVETFENLIIEEEAAGFVHPLGSHDLAYLIVRIMESFIYADMITGDEPDAAKVEAAVAALLHAELPS